MYKLKPFQWSEQGTLSSESPTHFYNIQYDPLEKSYVVVYVEKSTNQSNKKYVKTIEQGKQWCEEIHTPSKLLQWFDYVDNTKD